MPDLANLTFLWKTSTSVNGECPALFKVDGGYVGVGKALTTEQAAAVHAVGSTHDSGIGVDEVAVFFPAEVLDRLAR